MVKYIVLAFGFLAAAVGNAQPTSALTLEEAYYLLESRYPLLKNLELLERRRENASDRIDRQRLPGLFVKADGRLQSEATRLKAPEGSALPLDIALPIISVQAYAEVRYTLVDGGRARAHRAQQDAQFAIDRQELAIDRYDLRDRVNRLFTHILMLREQRALIEISARQLEARTTQLAEAVAQGIKLPGELTRLRIKRVELEAQREDLMQRIEGAMDILSHYIGRELPDDVALVLPDLPAPAVIPRLTRPELDLLRLQGEALRAAEGNISADRKPTLGVFGRAGTGYPNPLNLFDTNLSPFGLVGFSFQWRIYDWNTSRLQRENLALRSRELQNARATFEFNQQVQTERYFSEVRRLQGQIERDREMAELHQQILAQMAVQLDEGVITTTAYTEQLTDELSARQRLAIHQRELLQAQLDFWNERGAF